VSKTIDAEFANSPYETKTGTESAFAASWVKQFGNIELLVLVIGSVVFFTLLLVTGNTMAISVRERTGELAILKAIGFKDGSILFPLGLRLQNYARSALGGNYLRAGNGCGWRLAPGSPRRAPADLLGASLFVRN
jgi:hypothetical protein